MTLPLTIAFLVLTGFTWVFARAQRDWHTEFLRDNDAETEAKEMPAIKRKWTIWRLVLLAVVCSSVWAAIGVVPAVLLYLSSMGMHSYWFRRGLNKAMGWDRNYIGNTARWDRRFLFWVLYPIYKESTGWVVENHKGCYKHPDAQYQRSYRKAVHKAGRLMSRVEVLFSLLTSCSVVVWGILRYS